MLIHSFEKSLNIFTVHQSLVAWIASLIISPALSDAPTRMQDQATQSLNSRRKKTTLSLLSEYQENTDSSETLDEETPFLTNPEVESLEWLNALIAKVWRCSLRGLVERDVRKLINQKIKQVFASKGIPLNIVVAKMDIGDLSPWLTGIKVYDKPTNPAQVFQVDAFISITRKGSPCCVAALF